MDYFKKPSELKAPGQCWPGARTKEGPVHAVPRQSTDNLPEWA